MANIRCSTGDDEFRSYMNDFESYLHNIGSNARTASPELMTSSVENGEQVDWHSDVKDMSDKHNIAQFNLDQPYANDETRDLYLDEQYDINTSCQQTVEATAANVESAVVDNYFYDSQQIESDENQPQQQQYSVYETDNDVTADVINEPAHYANTDTGSDDYVPEMTSATEGVGELVPQSQAENHLTDNNDDDDDDDDETDDYIEHEYLIAERTPPKQQPETLDNDVTPVVDSDDRSTDDNGEGITDSLTEGEYYVSQQSTCEVQQTYYGTGEHDQYVTSDVHQYYDEDTTTSKMVGDEELLKEEEIATQLDVTNATIVSDDGTQQQYSQHLQNQHEDDNQFYEQTKEITYYESSIHSNCTTVQNLISVADNCIDNELHRQQYKQVTFSTNNERLHQHVTHDDDVKQTEFNDNTDDHVDNQQDLHDDDGNEQRPSERGRIRDLLAHWRQFEQQFSRSESRSTAGNSGQHTRSRSCGPVTRRHHMTTYDNSRSNDDSATPYNVNDNRDDVDIMNNLMTSSDREYKRAAILAKFENLDAEAHRSSIVTKKREFKWAVKEPTTLGRPVGLHCS